MTTTTTTTITTTTNNRQIFIRKARLSLQLGLLFIFAIFVLANHYSNRSEIFLNGLRSNKQSMNSQFHIQTQILIFFPLQLMFIMVYFLHSFKTSMLHMHVYFIRFVLYATSALYILDNLCQYATWLTCVYICQHGTYLNVINNAT